MEREPESEGHTSWCGGFADGLAGNRSPKGDRTAYRSGYMAGSVQRVSKRTMMAVALAIVALPAASSLASPGADPVFAAIERHKLAWETLTAAGDDHARWDEAVLIAETELIDTRPTTPAGVAALRAYHQEARYRERLYQHSPDEYRPHEYWREQYWRGWGKG
jgi:hypothetical protein